MEQTTSYVEKGFRRIIITVSCLLCILLAFMNIPVFTVAWHDISAQLNLSSNEIIMMTMAYTMGNILIIPMSPWFAGFWGRRNALSLAIIIFIIASFLCGNATIYYELLLFRFIQGIAGGAMLILAHTILTESWTIENRVISQLWVIFGILAGRTYGAAISGYITDNYSWAYIFFADIPVGIIAAVLVMLSVRNGKYDTQPDWRGNLQLVISIIMIFLAQGSGSQKNLVFNPYRCTILILGLSGLILYVVRQNRLLSSAAGNSSWQDSNLRKGLLLTLIATIIITDNGAILASMAKQGVHISGSPLIPCLLSMTVTLLLTAFVIKNDNNLKYAFATGFTIMITSFVLTFTISWSDLYWLLIYRSVGFAILMLASNYLTLYTLDNKSLGKGVALYHFILALGTGLGAAIAFL